MKRTVKLPLAGALALVACGAFAQENQISYDYVDVSFVKTEFDSPDVDSDGYAFEGSKSFAANWNMIGGYSLDNYGSGLEHKSFKLGLGFHHPVEEGVDLAVSLSWVDTEFLEMGLDSDGWAGQVMLRGKPTEKFHMDIGGAWIDLGSGVKSQAHFLWSGRYFFMNNLSGALNVRLGDGRSYGAGLRWEFR